jgi:hypothetical protein
MFLFQDFQFILCHAARLIDPDLRSKRLTLSVNAGHTSFRAAAEVSFSQWDKDFRLYRPHFGRDDVKVEPIREVRRLS